MTLLRVLDEMTWEMYRMAREAIGLDLLLLMLFFFF